MSNHTSCKMSIYSVDIELMPYGIMGKFETKTRRIIQNGLAPEDANDIVIVDPAGMNFIKSTASGAGGASGNIYKWLGLYGRFPSSVREGIKDIGYAKYHEYSAEKKVIHTVGPNFSGIKNQKEFDYVIEYLIDSYYNVFIEFANTNNKVLRLLPVSSGIFSGIFSDNFHTYTIKCIEYALKDLGKFQHIMTILKSRKIELCIYNENDFNAYKMFLTPPTV